MTCSRFGWINTGSLVAFWPIACSKHNIPSSKSIFEPINYNINLHLTEEHVDHDVGNVYQEMIIYPQPYLLFPLAVAIVPKSLQFVLQQSHNNTYY